MSIDKPKHDIVFKKALENPIVANEFLTTHLPQELIKIIDFSILILQKESFIENDLTNRVCDVLFSTKFNGTDGFIHILLEHVRHEVAQKNVHIMH